ncbi:MAG TPA: hypothetical protein VGJ20_37205 [Xanthobacteraceae bacterium]|jgi:hypothetical protein
MSLHRAMARRAFAKKLARLQVLEAKLPRRRRRRGGAMADQEFHQDMIYHCRKDTNGPVKEDGRWRTWFTANDDRLWRGGRKLGSKNKSKRKPLSRRWAPGADFDSYSR